LSRIDLSAVPEPLTWQVEPDAWSVSGGGELHIGAGRETDLFHDPGGDTRRVNAPRAVFQPDPLFTLSARVAVGFKATFDAGALLVWADGDHWGKLCFEYSPQNEPMVVSVVTNTWSDDCNSVVLPRSDIYLRIARQGRAFAFHYSEEGRYWRLVRHFTLNSNAPVVAGFVSQSPTGLACTATFSEIAYSPRAVEGIRSGA